MAHLGALAILLSFGILQGGSWHFTFDAMRAAHLPPARAAAAFLLALVGFGAKAGLVPLHVWLPEAHPAAPSPVSALLSGVMLKTAVYGMLRVTFDLLGHPAWWWGLVPLAAGLLTALYGVVFAAVQTDMKRLLAYSSIENVGLLFTGLGLARGVPRRRHAGARGAGAARDALPLAQPRGHEEPALPRHGLGAACDRPAQPRPPRRPDPPHAVGRRPDAGRRRSRSPACRRSTASCRSGCCCSRSSSPIEIPRTFVNLLLPLGAAVVALCAALAAYVMVKFYGVIFLGQPRESSLAQAHDCGPLERLGLGWLALACVALGLAPVPGHPRRSRR